MFDSTDPEYINGPFLKNDKVRYRHYQKNIVDQCKERNSLVILQTGLGKTIIGILMISNCLKKYPKGKILVLAPTRPLIWQHEIACKNILDIEEKNIIGLTGRISPKDRMILFEKSKIIISTPQVIKNDLERERYDLERVSLIIFDEAHRTRGNYSYNFISHEYINGGCTDPLILALTASPGKDLSHIQEICDNLFIENIVYKSHEADDVKQYIHDIDVFIEKVELSIKLIEICEVWNHLLHKILKFFIDGDLINPNKSYHSKLDILRISHDLTLHLQYERIYGTQEFDKEFKTRLFFREPTIMEIMKENKLDIHTIFSYCSSCISLLHGKELLETQNITIFKSYLDKLKYKADNEILSAKRIANTDHFNLINLIIQKEGLITLAHPKIERIISIIWEEIKML